MLFCRLRGASSASGPPPSCGLSDLDRRRVSCCDFSLLFSWEGAMGSPPSPAWKLSVADLDVRNLGEVRSEPKERRFLGTCFMAPRGARTRPVLPRNHGHH